MFKGIVIGRLGQDPEKRKTRNGHPMCVFSVADNRRYTNADGERIEATTWVSCVAYRRHAEIIQENVKKGHLVYLEGTLSTRDYVRQDGTPGYAIELDVSNIQFLQPRDPSDDLDDTGAQSEPETGWDPEI